MIGVESARRVTAPALPVARGPLSEVVLAVLGGARPAASLSGSPGSPGSPGSSGSSVDNVDALGDDLQLALYCSYELHYRGFDGVSDDLEWDPDLLRLRAGLEGAFVSALRGAVAVGSDVAAEVDALLVEPVDAVGVSHHLKHSGELWQLREYVAHRSLYHLKEADPQMWVVPRLDGQAKASMVAVEHDEYGAGRGDAMHARLFAEMMSELGLLDTYGAYLDAAPAVTLAEVNLMSYCGLHRKHRGALVGQFAVVELTSSPGSDRLVRAMRRLGCGPASIRFYAEHVEADAVHEQVVRHGVLADLLGAEPELAPDVVFGMRAAGFLGARFADWLLAAWADGQSSLRRPLDRPDSPRGVL